MSEKRFVYGMSFAINSDDSLPCITDSEKDMDYFRMSDVCNVLNEQQTIINELKEAIDYLKTVIRYTIPNEMVADVFKQIGEEYE